MFECPHCNGRISRYYAELRVCQDCKHVVNLDDLIKLLKNLGVTDQTIQRVYDNLAYPKLFAS
ncbi:MAG: hypothetical protein NWF03_05010 [Candidatus Bathyarchaeota archaeon]|nr:hypothetical protein [Candidatus Bathyarchaeota archaeon]